MDLGSVLTLIILVVGYFIPSIIAYSRGHKNSDPILLVNLLLGWMLIGWVIALIWSFTDNVRDK